MSKWTDVRDNVVDALHVSDVTEDVKQHVTSALLSEVVPVIENAVDSFCAATKEQSKTESGWCKIRDRVVLPLVMQGGLHHQARTQQDCSTDGGWQWRADCVRFFLQIYGARDIVKA